MNPTTDRKVIPVYSTVINSPKEISNWVSQSRLQMLYHTICFCMAIWAHHSFSWHLKNPELESIVPRTHCCYFSRVQLTLCPHNDHIGFLSSGFRTMTQTPPRRTEDILVLVLFRGLNWQRFVQPLLQPWSLLLLLPLLIEPDITLLVLVTKFSSILQKPKVQLSIIFLFHL